MNKISQYIPHKLREYFNRFRLTEHSFMFALALIIGLLSGFTAVGIRILINEISGIGFTGSGTILSRIIETPWYLKIIIPFIGGLIVGPIIYRLAPEAKGHGVPEVMQAILLKGGVIRPRVALVKSFASAVTIGTGGSVGREGPIIQIGAALGSTIGQFFKVHSSRLKILVGCGAAAGIAASFNAPIAGALFAVEIILMDFAISNFSPIVIASVTATVVSHHYEGNYPAFTVPSYSLVSPYELIFYVLLGIFCGLVSYSFIKTLYYSEDLFDNRLKFPPYLKPALGGIGLGVVAVYFPQVMGMGYDSIVDALSGNVFWTISLALVFLKILATSLTIGSGNSGGIFSPSLFMGVMAGSFFGYLVHQNFPDITASPGAYALVAMGGLVAGTTRAPLTAIIIIFEMTKDYNIILPLMITCIISLVLSSLLSRESIYTLKLILRNINIKEGTDVNLMKSISVNNVIRGDFDYINSNDNFKQVIEKVINGKGTDFPVIDEDGNIHGIISINDVKGHFFESDAFKNLLIASDLSNLYFDTVYIKEDCHSALEKIRRFDFDGLPVVEKEGSKKIIGMIWAKDIQEVYQKEIEQHELASRFASSIIMKQRRPHINFIEGYSIAEIKVPESFIGRSIKEINIRKVYGADVLSIKQADHGEQGEIKAIPGSDYVFTANDYLIIAGDVKSINLIRNLK